MDSASSPCLDPSTIYSDALIDARSYSTDALLAMTETFAIDAADPDPVWPGESGRFVASERLRALRVELERRERIDRLRNGTATTIDRSRVAWTELARAVRERVELPLIFGLAGYALQPAGLNGTRNAMEWAGPCPVCGGSNRFRVWGGPNGRAWCRQCDLNWDVVTATMSLIPDRAHFRDAVRWLAELAGAGSEVPR